MTQLRFELFSAWLFNSIFFRKCR